MSEVSSALGSGDALKSKINSALRDEGLEESTGLSAVTSSTDISSAARLVTPMWSFVLLLVASTGVKLV
jgi:hypothetical protein